MAGKGKGTDKDKGKADQAAGGKGKGQAAKTKGKGKSGADAPPPPPPPPCAQPAAESASRFPMAHERLLLVARRLSLALGCHFRCGSDSPLMLHLLSYDALLVSLAPHAARASKLGAQANALADAAQARRAARRLQPGGADQTLHVARDDIGRAADRWIPPQAELALAAAAAAGGAAAAAAGADGSSRQPAGLCGLYSASAETFLHRDGEWDAWELRLGSCGLAELKMTTRDSRRQRTVCRGFWGAANTAVSAEAPSDGYLATAFAIGCGQETVASMVGKSCFFDRHMLEMAPPGLFVAVLLHVCWSEEEGGATMPRLWSNNHAVPAARLPPHCAGANSSPPGNTSLCPLLFSAVALDGGGVALVSDWARLLGRAKQKDGVHSAAEQELPLRAMRRRALSDTEECAAHAGLTEELERMVERQLRSTAAGFVSHPPDVVGHWSVEPGSRGDRDDTLDSCSSKFLKQEAEAHDRLSSWASLPLWRWSIATAAAGAVPNAVTASQCWQAGRWTVAVADGGRPVAAEALSSAARALTVDGHPDDTFNGVYIRDHSPCSLGYAEYFPFYQISERYPRYVKPATDHAGRTCYLFHANFSNHRGKHPGADLCRVGWILSHHFGKDQPKRLILAREYPHPWSAALPTVGPLPVGQLIAWIEYNRSNLGFGPNITINVCHEAGTEGWMHNHAPRYLDQGN
jgi:hypothetical protein